MGLFKDVKKPVIRQAARATAEVSPLRPKFVAKQPPCGAACGAGVDVRAWLTLLAQADSSGRSRLEAAEEAWRVLADANPFPATLGRICPHSCEQACYRRAREGAVAINALERWLGDVALAHGFALPLRPRTAGAGRIAVVGAGPAGLSCACELARRGHQVSVLEARDVPGGRLRDAIRTGRLAATVVDAEIERVVRLGVTLRCRTRIAHDFGGLDAGYDAVFVATGRPPQGGVAREHGAPLDSGVVKGSRPIFLAGGDAVTPGLIAAAIGSGRLAAERIDATISGASPGMSSPSPPIAKERINVAWYPGAPRHDWPIAGAPAGIEAFDAGIAAEAKRCFSCGRCMDCERCWMFCTNNCFEKMPRPGTGAAGPVGPELKLGAYRLNVEPCNGCRKCADECPCGYIDMV